MSGGRLESCPVSRCPFRRIRDELLDLFAVKEKSFTTLVQVACCAAIERHGIGRVHLDLLPIVEFYRKREERPPPHQGPQRVVKGFSCHGGIVPLQSAQSNGVERRIASSAARTRSLPVTHYFAFH